MNSESVRVYAALMGPLRLHCLEVGIPFANTIIGGKAQPAAETQQWTMMCCMLPLSMLCACLYFLGMVTLFAARLSCTADSSQLNNNCGRSFKFLSSMIFFNTSKYSPMISSVAFEYRHRSITCDLLSVISCPYRFQKPCHQRNDGPVDGKD